MKLFFVRSTVNKSPHNRFVFLHGMGGRGSLWRPIAARLEDEYEVIAFDQRGHGESRGVSERDFSPLAYGNDVVETMRAQNWDQAWFVGHSMGVRTACAVAHLEPSLVRGLVLIDLGLYGNAGGGLGDRLRQCLAALPSEFSSREAAKTWLAANCPDASIAQYLIAVSEQKGGKTVFPFDREALIETIDAVKDFDLRDWIEEFGRRNLPVLFLRGERSSVWSLEEFEAEKDRFSAYPSLVFEQIAGTGHGLPFEKRQEFLDRFLRFTAP